MIAALAVASAVERAIKTIATSEKNTRIPVTIQGNVRLVKGLLARLSRLVNVWSDYLACLTVHDGAVFSQEAANQAYTPPTNGCNRRGFQLN